MDAIAILDFGSQYTQLIARKVREARVYCELFPWDTPAGEVLALKPKGYILSGGPASVYEAGAPQVPAFVLDSGQPVLGICYGMQALTHILGGKVTPAAEREYGPAEIETAVANPLIPDGRHNVWMSHGDRIERMPEGFDSMAHSGNSPIAAMGDVQRRFFGVQFHPEVVHTPIGKEILRRFAVEICGLAPDWTPQSIITRSIEQIKQQVGTQRVLAGVSGGVDSTVATALVYRAIHEQLSAVFVDHGLLRQDERRQVEEAFHSRLGFENLTVVDASDTFLQALAGVTEPEAKRRIIGNTFIRIFEAQARQLGEPKFLVQGTIYPDVVESCAPERSKGERIKTHHNVGGLPEDMQF